MTARSRMLVARVGRVLALAGASTLVGACGSASTAGGPAPTVSRVSAASCAALSPAAQFAGAKVVLIGTMLPGATLRLGNQRVLASPARVRVSRYLKGHGARVVSVATAVTRVGSGTRLSEDGITPLAGERWKVYSNSKRPPYKTATCAGSRRVKR